MNKKKGMLLAMGLVLLSGLAMPAMAAGDIGDLQQTPPTDKHYQLIPGSALSRTTKLDLWHYSGGYWMVTNPGQTPIKVTDDDMEKGMEQIIPAKDAEFTIPLPSSVKAELSAGKRVVPVIRSGSGADLERLFVTDTMTFQMDEDSMTFRAKPKFNLISTKILSFARPYGLKIPVTVPFIERQYGYNMYAVFGKGASGVQVNGWVNPNDKMSLSGMPSGWIHPSMIADTSGKLKSGYKIWIGGQNGKLEDSAGYSIGEGTFSNAGAMGLCFEYPVKFTFYVYNEDYVEPPPEPGKILCDACHSCELPAKGVCTENSCTQFNTPDCGCYVPPDIDATAVLALPPVTYETHPVTAADRSLFSIDGVDYSATRAYAEGYASNRFSIVQSGAGSVNRVSGSKTEADVVFPNKGFYNVELRVTPQGGSSLRDTKPIEVKKTPTILATLSGTQKQNRKQVLHINVATNADHPLTQLYVEIRHPNTGETVHLIHHLGSADQNVLENSELIKTRAIVGEQSDRYWTNCRLEFLTKNTSTADFVYYVYAKDARGLWDEVEVTFSVSPDRAPLAKIETESSYLRAAGSNTAAIQVKDGTATDGDQLHRVWSVANTDNYNGTSDLYTSPTATDPFANAVYLPAKSKPGYQDNSFGTGQTIQFSRTGVGKLKLKLEVKEVWTEETLPEYITEADYLTASALAITQVVDVAPMVSLEPVQARTAEVLLLAGGDGEYQILKENAAAIHTELLSQGVDANVTVEKMSPAVSDNITYNAKHQAVAPYGFQGTWSGFWESGSWAIDDQRLYKAEATWRMENGKDTQVYPGLPFVVRGYIITASEMKESWSYTLTADMLSVTDRGYGAALTQDLDGKYLYFYVGGKTILLDKATGAQLAVLDYRFGAHSTVHGNNIYTYQPDGIYRISAVNGGVKKIYSGRISEKTVRRLERKDHFLLINGTQINRGIFDPKTEQVHLERLPGTEKDDGRTKYRLAGIDTAGRLLVSCMLPGASSSDSAGITLRAYESNNVLLKEVATTIKNSYHDYVLPVFDSGGRMHYMGLTAEGKSSSYYRTYANLWGIDSSYSGSASVRDENGYPSMSDRILAGIEHGDGNCYIVTGAEWTYIANSGYNNGSTHGMPERTKNFKFDVKNGGASEVNLGSGVFAGLNSTVEYGSRSDAYVAFSTGDNCQDQGGAEHKTQVLVYGQSVEDILKRYANKHLSGETDLAAVLVYDSSNKAGTEAPEEIAALLQKKKAKFFFATENSKTEYGAQVAAAMGGKGSLLSASGLAASLVDALLEKETEGGSVLQLKTNTGAGSFERTYQLSPSTEYFYEYEYRKMKDSSAEGTEEKSETKDLLQLEAQYAHAVPEEALLADQYVVTHCFEEDFNDADTNPYFALQLDRVRDGIYYAANRTDKVSNNSNRYYTDGSSLSFTVPAGKKAIVSFDYDIHMDGEEQWMANGCFFGEGRTPWKNFVSDRQTGHYTHPDFLPEGVNTLHFHCATYDRGELFTWTRIDNLRVIFVEPSSGKLSAAISAEAGSSERQGWEHVEGSFTAPGSVAAFTAMPSEHYSGQFGQVPYTSWLSTEAGDKRVQLTLPKTALFANVQTSSSPASKYNVSYQWGSYSWTCNRSNKYPESAMNNIPTNYVITLKNLTGTQQIRQRSNDYKGAYGHFAGVELLLTEGTNALTANNRYFVAEDKGGQKKAFVENDSFTGQTTFRFAPGSAGEYQLRNLKIYSIQNGVRVYAENSSLAEQEVLTKWTVKDSQVAIVTDGVAEEPEEEKLIYKKGELISYKIHYFDYETDPSKKQYWRYTHTPFNDGPHPEAAVILDETGQVTAMPGKILPAAINRFYIDGKYTVEHWQEDDTTRDKQTGGNPDYDKTSNVEGLTFYIQGGGAAPWITSIKTMPGTVEEGEDYRIRVGVDDAEKDVLRLFTEVYLDGKLFYTHNQANIAADPITQQYPAALTAVIPKAKAGRYEVVCTVRDWAGTGLGSYRFTVVSQGRILGAVSHTEQWDKNRKRFNLNYFGEECNAPISYNQHLQYEKPRPRGSNVFWSGEEFVLRAEVSGKPRQVYAQILGYPAYRTQLSFTGEKTATGEAIYSGSLWEESMLHKWGRKEAEELTFRFTAVYEDGSEKIHNASIIIDDMDSYWLLHRLE